MTMKHFISTVLVTLIMICPNFADASIHRYGSASDFSYSTSGSQMIDGDNIYMSYEFRQYMIRKGGLVFYTKEPVLQNRIIFITSASKHLMSKRGLITLHIKNRSYAISNNRYTAKNKGGGCEKYGKIPLSVGDDLYNAITSDTNLQYGDIYFSIPLENGHVLFYTPTAQELKEIAEAYVSFVREINS